MEKKELIKQGRATRMTNQRLMILDYLQDDLDRHPSAEEINRFVRKKLPKISFGTVYRNLEKLVSAGVIKELKIEKGISWFDGDISNHFHFYCKKCKQIFNVVLADSWQISERTTIKTGHKVLEMQIYLFGICKNCLRFVK